MRTIAIAAAVLSYLFTSVASQAQAPKLPAVVATDLKAVAAQCVEAGGKALTTEAVKRADLNGDGK